MNFISKNWFKLILILLGLTPLIWFIGRDSVLIDGLDTNFPLDPILWFTRRFFVWNNVVNAGSDFSSSTSGVFFHLIQVIPYWLGANLQSTEIFSLIFWFMSIIFASYYFSKTFTENKFARLTFVIIYSFNIYLFNTWENVKVSNLSLVVSLPLVIALLENYRQDKLNRLKLFVFACLSAVFSIGSGINPAYFFTINLGLVIYCIVFSLIVREASEFKKVCLGLFEVILALLLVNSFWILPLFNFLFLSQKIGSITDIGFTNWLDSLSKDTSILNILRIQGAWDWYATDGVTGLPLYIPYALNYFTKLPFIIFSFFIPFLAIISLIFHNPQKKLYYSFFGLLIAIGVFLGAGSHEPTGSLYKFLVNRVSFLSFFRSPWYIFTPLLILGFAGLVSLIVETFYFSLSKNGYTKQIFTSVIFIFLGIYLTYNYPLITGKIFRPQQDGFFIHFPEYVLQTKDWLRNDFKGQRIISYPDDQLENFGWGYKGTESILGLISNNEFMAPSFNYPNPILQSLFDQFETYLKKGQYQSAINMMSIFDSDTIFDKDDIVGSLAPKIDSENNLLLSSAKRTNIGPWSFYQLKDNTNIKKIYTPTSKYINISNSTDISGIITALPQKALIFNDLKDGIVNKNKIDQNALGFGKFINQTIFKNPTASTQNYTIEVRKSGNYKFYIEGKGLNSPGDLKLKVDSIPVNLPFKQSESYFVFGPISLGKGNHELQLEYPVAPNLINISSLKKYADESGLEQDGLPEDQNKTLVLFNNTNYEKKVTLNTTFDPFLNYEFTFDYKYFYGSSPLVEIIQSSSDAPIKSFTENIAKAKDWQQKPMLFQSIPTYSKLNIVFHMPANYLEVQSKMFIRNLSMVKIYDNDIYIVEDASDLQTIAPEVHFTQSSPVEYNVEVKNIQESYYLVFLESYSPDWELISNDQNKSVHFTANGYANGWYIPANKQEQNLKIYYKPQRLFNTGLMVSLITLISSLIIVIYFSLENKNE